MTHNSNQEVRTTGDGTEVVADLAQQDFTDEQKNYLQGFVSGSDVARAMRGLPPLTGRLASLGLLPASNGSAPSAPEASPQPAASSHPAADEAIPSGPEAIHYLAQNRFLDEGKQLVPEEQA